MLISYRVVEETNWNELSQSLLMYEKAKEILPGGVTANIKYFSPHPIYMSSAIGSHLFDVDGNEYIDYLLCYGALILGHGHSAIKKAVLEQMMTAGTTVFGAPTELETVMAKKLCELIPSMEMVRFTNSGLEATLLSIRIAQAYTGKSKIGKFEGHYHGGYNEVLVSVNPKINEVGDLQHPNTVPESKGIPHSYLENTIVLPFNRIEETEQILRKYKDELAAVILEPIQGGFIPADEQFLKRLRELTNELGILLIFDEVKTGFRVTVGGVQTVYGVEPDLTTLGKVIGGGFPVGAVGGKKEIMNMMAPDQGRDILVSSNEMEKELVLFHSGTYNGHPTVLAAGLATIEYLEKGNDFSNLLERTKKLRTELENLYQSYEIPMQTLGLGTIFNIILTDKNITNYRDLAKVDMKWRKELDEELLKLGIYTKPLNRYSLSTAHTEQDIAYTIYAHEKAIQKIKGRGGFTQ